MKLRNLGAAFAAIVCIGVLTVLLPRNVLATLPVDVNWQGIGVLYANNPGQSQIGIKPNRFLVVNSATAAQAPVAATRTYITGSQIPISPAGLQVGTTIQWQFDMTKTAAGSASSTFDIAFGTAGTTADTAQLSFTKPGGVANADECQVTITCVIQSVNASTGVVVGEFMLEDNQTGTGGHLASGKYIYAQTVTSGSFNTTFAGAQYVGICITSGASDAITINWCSSQATGL